MESEVLRKLEYEKKKQKIVQEFSQFHKSNDSTLSLKKKTSTLFRHRKREKSNKLDVRQLNKVISIDRKNMIVETEAMITYEELVKETLKYSLLPAVVPELKSVTIGGAFVGIGIESSSFRYGLVHETITEIEVLTGTGTVVICSPDNEYQDLFHAFANSFGSLGYIIKLKAKLIPAKKFVHLSHSHFSDSKTFFHQLQKLCEIAQTKKTDSYIEGTIFNKNELSITLGEFADNAPFISDYTWRQVYYQSIPRKDTDFLTASDYIWRWDSDCFWCSKHFGMNYPLLRLLFGKFMLKSTVYWKLLHLAATNPILHSIMKFFTKPTEPIIQDILIPINRSQEFLEFLFDAIGITPIWVCPYQAFQGKNKFSFIPTDPEVLYIDFGFWDAVPSNQPKGYYNRLIEQKVKELKGFKTLYSDSFYTEQEFWEIYSNPTFFQLKNKYDPNHKFKNIFDKCVTKGKL